MNNITRINHIGLRVNNFERSRDFYAQFGFIDITGPTGPEPVAIVEHPSGINVNFILNANQPKTLNVLMDVEQKNSGYTHVALEVESAEVLLEDLKARDIALSGGPVNHPSGTSYFVRDPDDNVIEFIEYKGLGAYRDN